MAAGDTFKLTIRYNALDSEQNNALATGLGFRLHYDSSQVDAGGLADFFRVGGQGFVTSEDAENYDEDESTDMFFSGAYASSVIFDIDCQCNKSFLWPQPLRVFLFGLSLAILS